MAGNLNVFVSSTSYDLFQERLNIANGLLEQKHNVIISELPEHMPVNPNLSTVENCLEAIENNADILIVVVAARYGTTDKAGKSITMQEYTKAVELGIPIMAFVRNDILKIKKIWDKNHKAIFKPVVENNGVFTLIDLIEKQKYGNWIFGYNNADDITNVLKFQISVLLKKYLEIEKKVKKGIYFKYVNQNNIMLNDRGLCYRTIQYCLVNNTNKAIKSYLAGDTTDEVLGKKAMNLKIFDNFGNKLKYKFNIFNLNHRRWDVFFNKPIESKGLLRFYTQYLSYDKEQYQGQHTRYVEEGMISYTFPKKFISKKFTVEINDLFGWKLAKNATIYYNQNSVTLNLPYNKVDNVHQFRIKWK